MTNGTNGVQSPAAQRPIPEESGENSVVRRGQFPLQGPVQNAANTPNTNTTRGRARLLLRFPLESLAQFMPNFIRVRAISALNRFEGWLTSTAPQAQLTAPIEPAEESASSSDTEELLPFDSSQLSEEEFMDWLFDEEADAPSAAPQAQISAPTEPEEESPSSSSASAKTGDQAVLDVKEEALLNEEEDEEFADMAQAPSSQAVETQTALHALQISLSSLDESTSDQVSSDEDDEFFDAASSDEAQASSSSNLTKEEREEMVRKAKLEMYELNHELADVIQTKWDAMGRLKSLPKDAEMLEERIRLEQPESITESFNRLALSFFSWKMLFSPSYRAQYFQERRNYKERLRNSPTVIEETNAELLELILSKQTLTAEQDAMLAKEAEIRAELARLEQIVATHSVD